MTEPNVADLLVKADRSLAEAEALLLSQDLSFSKHSAVVSAFGQHFVKTGILDSSLHRHLLEAFDLRNLGDYGAVDAIDAVDARLVLENAKVFCVAARNHLALPGSDTV